MDCSLHSESEQVHWVFFKVCCVFVFNKQRIVKAIKGHANINLSVWVYAHLVTISLIVRFHRKHSLDSQITPGKMSSHFNTKVHCI